MQHIVLCDGDTFKLERWGKGLAYALTHKPTGLSSFVQGDDALAFEADLEGCELTWPENTPEQNAAWLWDACDYAACAA
jgi:hypothetical protein